MVGIYGMAPPYILYLENLRMLTPQLRTIAMGGMAFIAVVLVFIQARGAQPFRKRKHKDHEWLGFTLIELLLVISIIGVLSTIIFPVVANARKAAYTTKAKAEFKILATALELYANDHGGGYPVDANRGLPPGIEAYLGPGEWPNAPWPGSVYDWDHWSSVDLTHDPKQEVVQISVRFCPLNQPAACTFPNESWAENFDYYSAAYYCLSGPCRSHSGQPVTHPGYCIGGVC